MRRSAMAAGFVLCASMGAAKADCARLGNNITALVCPLGAYDPNPITYTRPTCVGTSPDADKNALQGAFMLAPSRVKEEICRLKHIFVLPTGNASWGLWENPLSGQTPNGERPESYVGISSDAIAAGVTILDRENAFVRSVIRGAGASITHSTTNTLNAEQSRHYAILSVLAHEIGHIKWHRDNIYSSLPCFYEDFVVPSWVEASMPGFRTRRWAPLFSRDEAKGGTHKNAVPQPPGDFTLPDARAIYDGGYATAVGAVSPEEDFVEAYRITTFRRAGLQLSIRIPPDTKSVTQNASASRKFECLERSLF